MMYQLQYLMKCLSPKSACLLIGASSGGVSQDLDVQFDSLSEKLFLVCTYQYQLQLEKPNGDVPSYMSGMFQADEGTKLQRELQMLEKQSILSNMCAESVNEAVHLLQENFPPDMFQGFSRTDLKDVVLDFVPEMKSIRMAIT
ncbi:hypothetical protein Scep_022292 [Stephania cephalantha]|uniref:Uncharacterized protein n=1 Tax=Stephania cephalantha TaxID=152367 RepID=A0AAP0HXM3_9MAGN